LHPTELEHFPAPQGIPGSVKSFQPFAETDAPVIDNVAWGRERAGASNFDIGKRLLVLLRQEIVDSFHRRLAQEEHRRRLRKGWFDYLTCNTVNMAIP